MAGGANALVFQNYVTSALGGTTGDINNPVQSVKVSANSDSSLYNLAAAAGIGGTAGVTAVAVITYFYNETLAYVKENSRIYAAGAVDILADSKEFVTADAAGAAGSGTVSGGGTLDVVVTKVVTKAYTEKNVLIHAKGTTADVSVKADDDYKLIAVVGTISASGVAAVAVSVLTTVSYNTVSAEIGEGNIINAGRDIIIQAKSDRLVQGYVFTAGAGQAGVSGSVMVIVAGSLKLDRDGRRVFVNEKEINLTAKEFDLLELLVCNPNKVYSREALLAYVWGKKAMDSGDVRTVDVHVRRLREKIEPSPSAPQFVHTKWGVGYYFAAK